MKNRCCLSVQFETCLGKKPSCSFLGFCGLYCCALSRLMMGKFKDKRRTLFCSRSCLGCCATLPLSTAGDEPSKGLKIQSHSVKKPSFSEDFWSTSTCEMDNSAVHSQRNVSSMSTSVPLQDPHKSACGTSNPTEFVNQGLLLWNQTRQQWIANERSENRAQVQEPKLSWNASYENLLGTNKHFPQSIPLAEMVDFLVDIWELEGLYD